MKFEPALSTEVSLTTYNRDVFPLLAHAALVSTRSQGIRRGTREKTAGKEQPPYCFEVNNGELFAFAGLWDRWRARKER